MNRQRWLLLGTLLLLFPTSSAQTHHEVVTVEVVDVPVYVISHGKPVRDLTKGDFELFVNDKRQAIEYFDRIDFAAGAASAPAEARQGAAPVADPRERRLFLLLFDLAYDRPSALARAQKAAATMVDRALPPDFFSVATYSSQGANFIIPFTRDRDVIRRAVLQLAPSSAHDALAISITNAERETAESWVPVDSGGGRMAGEDPMTDLKAIWPFASTSPRATEGRGHCFHPASGATGVRLKRPLIRLRHLLPRKKPRGRRLSTGNRVPTI